MTVPFSVACRADRTFTFDPRRTALLSIDMQVDFLTEADGTSNAMAAIVPAVHRLQKSMRQCGAMLIHTRESYAPDLSDVSSAKAALDYVGKPGANGRYLVRGEAGCEFTAALKPEAGEPVLDKPSFGAFVSTDLDARLKAADIENLILCGVTTECCVHSTLREAVDRDYRCLTVADCCAAPEQVWHDAAISLIAAEGHLFGWVCNVADIEAAVGASEP